MNNLLVVTPCYSDDINLISKLDYTAKKFDIDYKIYGLGKPFSNFLNVKILDLINFLMNYDDSYKYVLYTDGFDSFFMQKEAEIIKRFETFKSDIVVAGSSDCYLDKTLASKFKKTETGKDFINSGQFMGKIKRVIEFLFNLRINYINETDERLMWHLGYLDKLGDVKIDYKSKLFYTVNEYKGLEDTCVMHFCGSANKDNFQNAFNELVRYKR